MKKFMLLLCLPFLLCGGCGEHEDKAFLINYSISGLPSKTTFMYGEEIDTHGLVISGIFSDGSTRTLVEGKDYILKIEQDVGVSIKLMDDINSTTFHKLPFYYSFLPFKKVTLEGGKSSPAEQIIKNIYNAMQNLDYEHTINGYDKFFLVYNAECCINCKSMDYPAYLTGKPFISVYCDEETSETTESATAFVKHLERNQDFYECVGSAIYETPYFQNGYISMTDLEYLETADPNNFLTPTIFLVELNGAHPGVTECAFGVRGESVNDKKQFLLDMWNHEGYFAEKK